MKIAQHNILYWRLLTALSIWWEKQNHLDLVWWWNWFMTVRKEEVPSLQVL